MPKTEGPEYVNWKDSLSTQVKEWKSTCNKKKKYLKPTLIQKKKGGGGRQGELIGRKSWRGAI